MKNSIEVEKFKANAIHLPGLNGIRAIAALLVVFSHTSLHISLLGVSKGKGIDMAGYGVTMFFVLSGYLITYLLLKEVQRFDKIDLKKFYIRRILRIWPLYYLALIFGCILMLIQKVPIDLTGLFFYVFLMANVPFVFGGSIGIIAQLWSVGVEEQFYLFWPWLFRWKKYLPILMILIIIIYMALRLILRIYENGNWYTFLGNLRFHCMAIGGLGALALHHQRVPKWIYSRLLQLFCWLVLAISVYQPFHTISIIDNELYAILFLVIILNVSSNPKPLFTLEHPLLNWLGKISYGIYVYHMFGLTLAFYFISKMNLSTPGVYISAYVLVTGLTLLMAHLSYQYFEKPFLKRKHLFAKVPSSPTAQKVNY